MKPIEQLQLFDYQVEQLRSLRFVRKGINNTFSINFDSTRGMSMSGTAHDEEDLRSYLLTFRKFMSPKEPVHLDRIYNICHQKVTSESSANTWSRRVLIGRKPRRAAASRSFTTSASSRRRT